MWTSDETVVTTTSITAVSGSMRSAHSECRSPEVMNENSVMRASWPPKPTSKKAYQDSTQEITRNVEVISSATSEPAAEGSASVLLLMMRAGGGRVRRIRRRRGVRMILGNQRGGMIVMRRRRVLARIAVTRAEQRDGAGDDGAEQRQDDNGLVHPASPSSD